MSDSLIRQEDKFREQIVILQKRINTRFNQNRLDQMTIDQLESEITKLQDLQEVSERGG